MNSQPSQRDSINVRLRTELEVKGSFFSAVRYSLLRLTRRMPRLFFWEDQPVRVIEVKQTQHFNEIFTVYIECLKTFRWGFFLEGKTSLVQGHSEEALGSLSLATPRICFAAVDDRGSEYRAINGYIEGVKCEFRFVHGFIPRLDPEARLLSIRLEEIPWINLDYDEPENSMYRRVDFTVSLK